jgi:hypothetical protein
MGLQIAHRIAASRVHGQGLFSDAPLAAGTVLWRFEPGLDDALRLDSLTPSRQRELLHYGYTNAARPGWVIVCGDAARFWNFPRPGEAPNAVLSPLTEHGEHLVIAAKPICPGEELLIEAASDADYLRKLSHLLAPDTLAPLR